MKETQITINWQQAQQVVQEVKQDRTAAITDFLESSHEMTDARDLLHYSEQTGKDIYWLIKNGNNISPLLSQPLLEGAKIDDVWNVDIFCSQEEEDETETPDLILLDGRLEVYFWLHLENVYSIYLEGKNSDSYNPENKDSKKYFTLNECKEINPKLLIDFAVKNEII